MDWQNVAALAIVAAAVVYLLWDAFKKRPAESPSCGGCGSCGKSEKANEPTVVTIK
jgi:hypothetical protein